MMKRIAVYTTACLMTTTALGLTDEERQALFHIHEELSALDRWITKAETATNPNDAYSFTYEQLQQDLNVIRQGINDAVGQIRREPRTLLPVKGTY